MTIHYSCPTCGTVSEMEGATPCPRCASKFVAELPPVVSAAPSRAILTPEKVEVLHKFARTIISELAWGGGDGGDVVQEEAAKRGLIVEVIYDPKKHGEIEHADIGERIYVYSDWLLNRPAVPSENMPSPSPPPSQDGDLVTWLRARGDKDSLAAAARIETLGKSVVAAKQTAHEEFMRYLRANDRWNAAETRPSKAMEALRDIQPIIADWFNRGLIDGQIGGEVLTTLDTLLDSKPVADAGRGAEVPSRLMPATGWKLVPLDPTPEMMEVYMHAFVSKDRFDGAVVYRKMVEAAPEPPVPSQSMPSPPTVREALRKAYDDACSAALSAIDRIGSYEAESYSRVVEQAIDEAARTALAAVSDQIIPNPSEAKP